MTYLLNLRKWNPSTCNKKNDIYRRTSNRHIYFQRCRYRQTKYRSVFVSHFRDSQQLAFFITMRLSTVMIYHAILEQKDNTYMDLLDEEGRRRRDRRMPRIAIRRFKFSSFMHLYSSGNDQALLNATGHDHRSFGMLLSKFKRTYDYYMVDPESGKIRAKQLDNDGLPMGHKRELNALGALGLVLMWYRTRGSCTRNLAMLFGQTSSPMYRWLKFSRKVLLHVLSRDSDSKVSLPTVNDVRFYQAAISEKYPLCHEVWGAADGLKLLIQSSEDEAKQNKNFNGWTHGHYINCCFVFAPDGKIRVCILNAPGTFHDSTMADYGVYDAMEKVYDETGGKVVVDSAFKIGNKDYLIKSSQQDPLDERQLLLNRQATSIRQLSEWGMRMIEGSFPRLKDPLLFEEMGDRKVILRLMVHLYNYQTAKVGINQIMNTFMDKTGHFGGDTISEDANDML